MADLLAGTSRRNFLGLAAAGAAAGITTAPSSLLARQSPTYPPDVGRKFYPDGRVHPFAGSTIICHLPQQGEHAACFNSILDIFREAPRHRFMRKVAMLPPSSYHMTVFGVANDQSRKRESWPADLPLDMPLEAVNRALVERLRSFELGNILPIRMRVSPQQSPENGRTLVFHLQPFDDAESAKLRRLRDRLANVLKIQSPGHDSYEFHISFGYPISWFDATEEREVKRIWPEWANRIASRSPEIAFAAPEYCTFDDMFAFHRQLYLGQNG
ncbi:DUF1868 domain-containing protein [Novosphingobium album (ex Liu et al. 2023)]|uniref:DUF1868 domain-containing protein n=1 Tax=Novosphingobium album (ex Liu et al. 2023) TaxID=3031130 RepID=A0ABT5WL01_9SPHN|nr:DUF1868 domain-containing protein [Novosphingobium album (ex Liu et al. 2023)]MDE8650708.1 DUF1868 domain-containing protein [Novosphingobium album (ex Liu et al. 2023)]